MWSDTHNVTLVWRWYIKILYKSISHTFFSDVTIVCFHLNTETTRTGIRNVFLIFYLFSSNIIGDYFQLLSGSHCWSASPPLRRRRLNCFRAIDVLIWTRIVSFLNSGRSGAVNRLPTFWGWRRVAAVLSVRYCKLG